MSEEVRESPAFTSPPSIIIKDVQDKDDEVLISEIVERVADEWCRLEEGYVYASLRFCKSVHETLEQFPNLSKKDVVKKISEHPKISTMSYGRLWSFLRIKEDFPEVYDYALIPEKRVELKDKVLLKKDNETLFLEPYHELTKHGRMERTAKYYLINQAKAEGHSWREFKDELSKARDKSALEIGEDRVTRAMVVRELIGVLKDFPVSKIRELIVKLRGESNGKTQSAPN